jgi:transcription antitermination factor NusG
MKKSIKTLLGVFLATFSLGLGAITVPSITTQAKAQEATLIPGTYTVGEDVKAGRYTVSATSGSGNFFNHPKKSSGQDVNEILGTDDVSETPSVTATFKKGDQVEISGMTSAHFVPVTVRNKKNTTKLGTGYWTVGKDIKKGKYTVSAANGTSGNFFIHPKNPFGTEVNEILGTDTSSGEVPKINVKLKKGDQIAIAGMSSANFTKR